jgi:hypothetical protein
VCDVRGVTGSGIWCFLFWARLFIQNENCLHFSVYDLIISADLFFFSFVSQTYNDYDSRQINNTFNFSYSGIFKINCSLFDPCYLLYSSITSAANTMVLWVETNEVLGQNSDWEADGCSDIRGSFSLLCYPKFHYHIQMYNKSSEKNFNSCIVLLLKSVTQLQTERCEE